MANYWIIFKVSKLIVVIFGLFLASTSIAIANVNSIEFKVSLLSVLSPNTEVVEFYEQNEFKPIWVGGDRSSRERRSYFLKNSTIRQSTLCQNSVMILTL